MQIQNKLIQYTQHEKDNLLGGKVRIIESNKDIENFILHSTTSSDNAKIYFGKVNLQFAKNINKLFKIDVKYYNISLSAHTIKHIFSHHGQKTELLRG